MSYLNRVWMAASVAVVNSYTDHSHHKFSSGLRSLHRANKRYSAGSDLRPLAGMMEATGEGAFGGGVNENGQQAEDSLRKVMFLNCWNQG
ncbi:hypothetical protein QQ045_016426 [Rhodiola kirilowii]